MRHQHDRCRGDEADRREVLARIVARTGVEAGIDRRRAGMRHGDRVAVRRGLGGDAHPEHARRAAAVVDDDLLAETGAELVGDDARNRVDAAARRERHDHGDRPRRILVLRRRALQGWRGKAQNDGGDKRSSALHAGLLLPPDDRRRHPGLFIADASPPPGRCSDRRASGCRDCPGRSRGRASCRRCVAAPPGPASCWDRGRRPGG